MIPQIFYQPTFFTLFRLIGAPLILPFFLVYLLPLNYLIINILLAGLFLFFCFTDFIDGYMARKYNCVTVLGAQLDPIADKFLLYSTLVALLAAQKLHFMWVIIFIGRELFVMGLRQIKAEQGMILAVSYVSKLKTFAQMMAITFVIINPYHHLAYVVAPWSNTIELLLLSSALIFSLVSAAFYFTASMKSSDPLEIPF